MRYLPGGSGGMPPPPPPPQGISNLLRSFLVYSWGEIAKAAQPTAKPSCCVVFEAYGIKGVTQLQAAGAAKQLAIRVR